MFFDIRQNLRNHRLGITPQLRKQSTLRSRIMPSPIPPLLVFPLLQPGYPLPAIPQVKKNQRVRKFDVLAVAAMSGHPCLFAPTSGTILDIAKADHPNACAEIRLQTDGKDSPASLPIPPDYRALGHQDLLLALAMAGIMDHGEQAQSLAEKLATAIEHRADLLVINAMESAPDVSANECLAREFADEVVAGAEVLQAASLTLRCVIAISAEKQDAIAALTRALAASSVELQVLPNRYPAGHERVLTRTLTGLRLDWQQQPHDAGLVICDTMTAVHAKRAIMDGEPVIKRVTTLSGNALRTPKNFLALLGTPVSYLLDICGVDLSRLELVILGNSITGAGLSDLQHPVSQGMNCVIATGTAELQFNLDAEPCIRCGNCIDACPVQLNPVSLAGAVKRHDEIAQEELGLLDCIECGACAWTCPSRIPLLQIFRAARQTLAADKQQAHIAGHWQARFEALLSRRRRQAGGEDKTTRAKQTAGSGFSRELAQQEIAAAVARVEARRGKVIAATSDRKEQK